MRIPPCIDYIGTGIGYICGPNGCGIEIEGRLACQRRKLAAGQQVFSQGDVRRYVYLVRSGVARIYKLLRDGSRQVVAFRFPGEFIDLARDSSYRFTAQAISATELRFFPIEEFHRFVSSNARVATRLLDAVSTDLTRAFDLVVTVGQRNAESSVATFLLDLAARLARHQDERGVVDLPMLRSDIADHLGITQETVSRILSSFKARGIVELDGPRRVRFREPAMLRALAYGASKPSLVQPIRPAAADSTAYGKSATPKRRRF